MGPVRGQQERAPAEERPFWRPRDRWTLPGVTLLSAVLQLGFLLSLPEAGLQDPAGFRATLDDRFITVFVRPPEEPKEEQAVAIAAPEKPKPKTKPKRKPKPKMKKRQRLRRRRSTPHDAPEAPAKPPGPPLPARPALVPALPASDSVVGDAVVIEMDLDLGAAAMSGGGVFGGAGLGGGGAGGGVPGGRGPGGPVRRSFEVDRLPVCPSLEPAYPRSAKRAEVEGDVVLRLQIGARGQVLRVDVKRGAGHGFDQAAVAAARALRCRPARLGGAAVAVWIDYEVSFRLVG